MSRTSRDVVKPSPLENLQCIRELLHECSAVSRLTTEEVRLRRAEPAVITDSAINVEGPSGEALLNARAVEDLPEALFDKRATKRVSTPDLPVGILDDFYIKEGSVACGWPDGFGPLNFGYEYWLKWWISW